MSWDPALLRKYTTTSHLKLLSQVRSELKEQPIQRPLVTTRSRSSTAASRRGGTRSSAESHAQQSPVGALATPAVTHNVTRRRSAAPVSQVAPVAAVEDHHQPIVAVPVLMDPVLHGHS